MTNNLGGANCTGEMSLRYTMLLVDQERGFNTTIDGSCNLLIYSEEVTSAEVITRYTYYTVHNELFYNALNTNYDWAAGYAVQEAELYRSFCPGLVAVASWASPGVSVWGPWESTAECAVWANTTYISTYTYHPLGTLSSYVIQDTASCDVIDPDYPTGHLCFVLTARVEDPIIASRTFLGSIGPGETKFFDLRVS